MGLDSLPMQELASLGLALLAAGALVGVLAGLFGIGGGSVLVPVLYTAFGFLGVPEDVRMQVTLGTSFAVIAPTGLRSFHSHRARGAVDMDVLRRLMPAVFAGVVAGVVLASYASSAALRWVWVVAAASMALKLALGRDDWRIADRLPHGPWPHLAAFAIGVLSALMSIGGGLFMVSLLMLYGFALLPAVATSSGFGPVIAIPGLIGFAWAGWSASGLPPLSLGYVNLLAAATILPSSLVFAPLGVRLGHGMGKRTLELAFAAFLALVSLKFLLTLIG